MKPGVLYKKRHKAPNWNAQKLKTVAKSMSKLSRISKDELYNLHEIAYDTGDFVCAIVTVPNLIYVCWVNKI